MSDETKTDSTPGDEVSLAKIVGADAKSFDDAPAEPAVSDKTDNTDPEPAPEPKADETENKEMPEDEEPEEDPKKKKKPEEEKCEEEPDKKSGMSGTWDDIAFFTISPEGWKAYPKGTPLPGAPAEGQDNSEVIALRKEVSELSEKIASLTTKEETREASVKTKSKSETKEFSKKDAGFAEMLVARSG